ncbi:uncharacterized protein DDB_G0284459-like isoform X2 [Pararge aegeria]|uniref:uncharacterized protein DDB_G0284459-like isoform X2 n=1 Tax=Pararge aegeria TaxID=116150 RepID=UPI0019CF9F96|nr:uncharacterized protein DDB_G0284459-like isoform X2 [Pararge aegeria]
MAWSMPNSGQWNPGIGMTADMMGSYTQEQWALMQQQNWQQWSQWQHQYAQWQNQIGGEYAKHLQGLQALAGFQPVAAVAVPPPVPPPDKPPPPPPHENDQPLYGSAVVKAVSSASTVKPLKSTQPDCNNGNTTTGNNQNRSYIADPHSEKQSTQGVNSEALRMLAEEEKSFDIQFQKWEEEIEKWKKENVNHPDKQAYREYEQKFEACRAQLLERRQLMKIKRDNLMGNVQPASTTTKTGNNKINAIPTPSNTTVTNYTPIKQTNVQSNVQNKNINVQSSYSNNKPSQYEQHNNAPHQAYKRNDNNRSVDPKDRNYDAYQNLDAEYKSAPQVNSSFMPASKSSKNIPGLDLVPEVDKSNKQEVIDITEDLPPQQQNPAVPDYSKISKGINNILGDEKIMNILSMMANQKPPYTDEASLGGSYREGWNMMQANQWNTNSNSYNNDNNDQPQNVPYRQQNNMNNYQNSQEPGSHVNSFDDTEYQMYNAQQGQYYNRQNQFANQNMPQRGDFPQFRSNIPPPSTNLLPSRQNMPTPRPNIPSPTPNMPLPNLNKSTFRPNMPHPRPLLQNFPPQQSNNDYPHGGIEKKELNQQNPSIQPVKPKWLDEPLFNPSITVEYDHKPLRLKARDFIEPVQMFDYDHKSKDGDNDIKKDFEKEVDELFSRKPRTTDRDVWSSERLFSRDYDRGSARDDFKDRSNVPNRFSEFYDRRVDDRRYDDRDRLRRQDFERRDRTGDNERLRDIGYGRDRFTERDLGIERDLERDKDFGRERDFRRDRDPGRDRDMDREMDVSRGRDFGRDRDLLRERDNGRDKNFGRDPVRDRFDRRDMSWNRSRSRDKDIRKRGHSRENDSNDSFGSKKTKDSKEDPAQSQGLRHVVMIDDLLEPPGRDIRPAKIIIILRGVPGSGKSYLAKLIRDKEAEQGVTVRIMSIDDYFMHESEKEEKDPITGKITKKPSLKYEYDETQVENYMNSLRRAFKRSLNDGFFTFLIFDAINDQLKSYAEIWSFGKQKGFQVYVCTMEADTQTCYKRNIHNRSLKDIEDIKSRFYRTPAHHIQLDATTLLQNASIREVQMEDAEDVTMEDADVVERVSTAPANLFARRSSLWKTTYS